MSDDTPGEDFGPVERSRPGRTPDDPSLTKPPKSGPSTEPSTADPSTEPSTADPSTEPSATDPSTEPSTADPSADPASAELSGASSVVSEHGDGPDAAQPAGSESDPSVGARRRRGKTRPKRKAPWWELPALVLVAIVIAIVVKSFLIQPFFIPSASMEKTLHGCPGCHGDRILVNKIIYDFRDPEPGDIVVFDAPKGWNDEPGTTPPGNPVIRAVRGFGQLVGFVPPDGEVLVKRVIASGGQTIRGDADGSVYVHDPGKPYRKLSEPYVFRDNPTDGDNGHAKFGPLVVPKGRLWVMGDHRDNSADSRFHCSQDGETNESNTADCTKFARQATVSDDEVIGKAFVIAWPPSRWRTLGTPSTFDALSAPVVPSAVPGLALLPLYALRRRGRLGSRDGRSERRGRRR